MPKPVETAPPYLERAARSYANLMEEVKIRVAAMDLILGGQLKALGPKISEEFCHLQLRFICELVALGCLVIHGDMQGTQTSKVQKKWAADEIFQILETLNPRFYPIPLAPQDIDGFPYPETIQLKNGFLTKQELITLYHECGTNLHRGQAKNILKGVKRPDFSVINKWRVKIIALLNRHQFTMSDDRWILFIGMQHATLGLVNFNIMRRVIIQPSGEVLPDERPMTP